MSLFAEWPVEVYQQIVDHAYRKVFLEEHEPYQWNELWPMTMQKLLTYKAPTIRELTLHILPHRHTRFNTALYGAATSHTSTTAGVRAIPLALESNQDNFKIWVPVIAVYDKHSKPIIITDKRVTKADWDVLERFAKEERILRVVLVPNGGRIDFLRKLTEVGGEAGDGKEAVRVGFL
ncbi:hypothetical protein K458DRAFT_391504 [Lentithecium fluviatile CBS 122367]|uniref:Uncharacterized protein n=1 Tax=Lentithecium fluviatile CBS 122367 TaxID=1168545 RepID=A0A6G1IVI3_9PLEO|nr:hypothetical protein K458DRAFT_391504 [Lentithecium fluviatile CBS 122367]